MPRADAVTRFRSKVRKEPGDGCWVFFWGRDGKGYGQFHVGTRKTRAHRFAYELLVGPIPAGMDLDHLCRNRRCVRPDHLEPVTRQENIRRGAHVQKTHCAQGHPYTPENVEIAQGRRRCKVCNRAAGRAYQKGRSGQQRRIPRSPQ